MWVGVPLRFGLVMSMASPDKETPGGPLIGEAWVGTKRGKLVLVWPEVLSPRI